MTKRNPPGLDDRKGPHIINIRPLTIDPIAGLSQSQISKFELEPVYVPPALFHREVSEVNEDFAKIFKGIVI